MEGEPVTLCGEDPDWNWWLLQTPGFRGAAVKHLREIGFECRCPNERAIDAMFARCGEPTDRGEIFGGMITPRHAIEAIERAGLQIVEKV